MTVIERRVSPRGDSATSDDITAAQMGGAQNGFEVVLLAPVEEKSDQIFPPESCRSQCRFILGLGQPSVGPVEAVGAASLTRSIGFGSRLVLRERHRGPAEPETCPRVDVSFWREALYCVRTIGTGSCFGVALEANGG